MTAYLLHLIQIAAGIGANATCALFLHVLGLLLLSPRHIRQFNSSLVPAFIGAAVTILWCSHGLRFDVPLPKLLFAQICVTTTLLFFRRPVLVALAHRATLRTVWNWLGLFALFYAVSYCFVMPPASSDFLPLVTAGNNDIFNYINCTRFLQFLGQSNLAGYSFRTPFGGSGVGAYDQVPAVYFAIYAISAFFGAETMRAAMPTMFGAVGLVGCAIVLLVKLAFNLPKAVCVALALILISGPFFRYNVGHYFLAQIQGIAVVLLMLAETARLLRTRFTGQLSTTFIRFLPFQVVLCFTYPVLSVIGLALQSGLVLFSRLLNSNSLSSAGFVDAAKIAMSWTIGLVCALAAAWLSDPWHGFLNLRNLAMLTNVGVHGWPLDLISPLAILGLPPIQISNRIAQIVVVAICSMLLLLVGLVLRRRAKRAAIGQAFFVLAYLSSLLYFAFFFWVGPTYQQWKLAAYLPLTLSFAFSASLARIVLAERTDPIRTRLASRTIPAICISAVAINLVFRFYAERPPQTFTADYASLRELDTLPGAESVSVDMVSMPATFLSAYYIRNKTLHLVSPSYYPQHVLNAEAISPQNPLFFEGQQCDPDRYRLPLGRLGCIFLREPTFRPEQLYHFNRRYLELAENPGLGSKEAWGRWSNENKVIMTLRAGGEDIARLPSGYLNFDLSPFVPPGVAAQQVLLFWGNGNTGRVSLSERSWVSIPVSEQDWQGAAVRTLSIEFKLPGAVSPKDTDARSSDSRRLAVGFVAVSWSAQLLGRVPDTPN